MRSTPSVERQPPVGIGVGGSGGAGVVAPGRSGPARVSSSMLDAVTDLRREVDATRFPLPLDGVDRAEARRREVLDQLDDHLLPRLRELSAPAVVVVAGSTGAGKSTLVNSLLGTEVSPAGVLRPTTRRPVLVHHPDDAELLTEHPLMAIVDVVAHDVVPRGLAVIDAPDLDSLVESNRSTAHRLLESADLWVFVTTAARYGDALPWEVLDRAAERGTSMAMVLNRVPQDAMVTVRGELMHRLRDRGMAAVPLFLVPDAGPHEGLLEPGTVAPILRWLTMVAGPDRARSVIVRTQRGSLTALQPWVDELAEAVQAQVDARAGLSRLVEQATQAPAERTAALVADGAVAEGPVRSVWTAATATGGPLAGRWSPRRGRAARAEVLRQLAQELGSATMVVLQSARRRGETAVTGALRSASSPVAATVLDAVDTDAGKGDAAQESAGVVAADLTPEESAADWLRGAAQELARLRETADRAHGKALARLVRAVGDDGAATVLAAAASGVRGAATALGRAVGEAAAGPVVEHVRADLVRRAREQTVAGASPARAYLDGTGLADDAASGLRLRLAELKGLR